MEHTGIIADIREAAEARIPVAVRPLALLMICAGPPGTSPPRGHLIDGA